MSHVQKNNATKRFQTERVGQIAVIFAAAALLALTGCNSMKDVRAARGSGTKRVFDASFERVWAAVPTAANELDLGVIGSDREDRHILVQRGITWWSWGEKIGVFVEPLGTRRTEVEVVSKKVVSGNVFAPNWERELLDQIAQVLGSSRP